MSPRRIPGPDWKHVGWHYKFIHRAGPWWHNRLLPVRGKGFERVPREGAFIFAGNHFSWWDGILMQVSIGRPVNLLVKKEIMRSRFGKWFFGRGGAIPVDREAGGNERAVEAALQALRDARVLGIFPEGGRSKTGELREPKSGVGRLALASGAPVLPIGILTDRFWPPDRKVPKLGEPVYMNVGEPMRFEGDPADREAAREVAKRVMGEIARLLDEARAARERGEKWPVPP